ncbi:MAG: hypothetical protein HZB55_10315 [Deltaproteobacteria bacterium]|nr:hypothetical protein [Deltaproteobacteria bacterium]
MNEEETRKAIMPPLGIVEPHAPLLRVPSDEQLLYKIMSAENLLRSIASSYIHFNRVDSYTDFAGADPHDGKQLPRDEEANARAKFERAPDYSAANYYDQSRARTYACCFSTENSDFIWKNYANNSDKGKICVVLAFGSLRATLNQTLAPGNAGLEYNGMRCHQIFSINYGMVEYVDRATHQANAPHLPNPIVYTYLKDKRKFADEKELRISLSTFGTGQFALKDGRMMQFPPSLHLAFDYRAAMADSTIQEILYGPNSDADFLKAEFHKLGISTKEGHPT